MLKGLYLLAEKLIEAGYPVVFLIDENLSSFFQSPSEFVFSIGKGDVESVNFVNVFITLYDVPHSGAEVVLPSGPALIACNHSFQTIEPHRDIEAIARGFSSFANEFDYYLMEASPMLRFSAKTCAEGLKETYQPGNRPRSRKYFSFIPVGYFNYDASIRYMEKSDVVPYALFYCHKRGYGRWQKEREAILEALLGTFPDETILYSAGPVEWVLPDRMDLIERLAHRGNFELGRDSSNLVPFSKAKICITSDSDTVLTFGICTLRPFIRCNFTLFRPIVRHEFGYDVHTPEQLCKAVAILLSEMAATDGPIVKQSAFELYTFNIGRACDAFISYLPNILKDEKHADWITIARPTTGTGKVSSQNVPPRKTETAVRLSVLPLRMRYDESIDYLRFKVISLDESDDVFMAEGATFMIWGASGGYHTALKDKLLSTKNNFMGFIDKNLTLQQEGVDGFSVHDSRILKELRPEIVFIASTYHAEIVLELLAILSDDSDVSK